MKDEAKLWLDQAEEHYKDMEYCYNGARFSLAIYSCHQTLEKLLKACIVENVGIVPPKNHQLENLAVQAKLAMTENQLKELALLTGHFWKVRYPDFRKHMYGDRKTVDQIVSKTKELYLWISKKLDRK